MALPSALSLSLSLLLISLLPTLHGHNITRILAKHPEFSTFNHYLTLTHLAGEINRRETITVCAVNNAAMSELLSRGLPLYTLKNVLSLHVFADYFGRKKLHQITHGSTLTATMFQATGEAPGTSGYVKITDGKGGKVTFTPEDNNDKNSATFIKSIHEMPYNISVIQISNVFHSTEAEAPTVAPSQINVTTLMAKQGCKAFSDLVLSSGASDVFHQSIEGGLTVFCPSDGAVKGFMPKYKNLTKSGKTEIILFHGIPIYSSLQTLKSENGLMNTLATAGDDKYDFTVQSDGEDVKLDTRVVTAKITATLVDEEPVILYKIDKVLLPTELFKAPPAPKGVEDDTAPGPGSDDSDYSDDSVADKNRAERFSGRGFVAAALGVVLGGLMALN